MIRKFIVHHKKPRALHVVRDIAMAVSVVVKNTSDVDAEASAFDLHGPTETQVLKPWDCTQAFEFENALPFGTRALWASYRGQLSIPPALRVVLYC